jgi:peptidoglycan-associated lipoprotein
MRKWIMGALLIALIAGCSSNPQQPTAPVEERSTTPTPGEGGTGATTGGATTPGVTGTSGSMTGTGSNPLRDPNNILSKRSVYFEFDSSQVKDDYRGMIEAHARWLQSHRDARITIQGNTDERGSREYNIALGQRRADAVRQMMRVLGAQDQQIETVSFGKEKPRNPGHDEGSWTENRRADILYSGE